MEVDVNDYMEVDVDEAFGYVDFDIVKKWIDERDEEHFFKGKVIDAYVHNPELQFIWENWKENMSDQLPEVIQTCYLFTEIEDLSYVTNYWRAKGMVRMSGAIITVGDRTMEESIGKYFQNEMARYQTDY